MVFFSVALVECRHINVPLSAAMAIAALVQTVTKKYALVVDFDPVRPARRGAAKAGHKYVLLSRQTGDTKD